MGRLNAKGTRKCDPAMGPKGGNQISGKTVRNFWSDIMIIILATVIDQSATYWEWNIIMYQTLCSTIHIHYYISFFPNLRGEFYHYLLFSNDGIKTGSLYISSLRSYR